MRPILTLLRRTLPLAATATSAYVLFNRGPRQRLRGYARKLREQVMARQRVEAALQASTQQYRDLIERSIQGVYIHRRFIILFANSACARMFGHRRPARWRVDVEACFAWLQEYGPDALRRAFAWGVRHGAVGAEYVRPRLGLAGARDEVGA